MPELEQKPQKRQVAIKSRIKDIINGKYVKEEGWKPNYIQTDDNRKISRTNIIGTIVFKSDEQNLNYKNFIVDDGSGKIAVRSFEENKNINSMDIGDVVLLIGRPREFGNEKYIIPEIVKKIKNPLWIEVRKLELKINNKHKIEKDEGYVVKPKSDVYEETVHERVEDKDPNDVIFELIRALDKGEGVSTEDIIERSKIADSEEIIKKMLERGDIFEIKRGKLKVLE